jgi:hypothetical protein
LREKTAQLALCLKRQLRFEKEKTFRIHPISRFSLVAEGQMVLEFFKKNASIWSIFPTYHKILVAKGGGVVERAGFEF